MEKSSEIIILRERAADFGSVRAVLRDWGYGESEIRDLLVQQKINLMIDEGMARTINLIVGSTQRLTKDEILTLVEIGIDHFIARFCQSDLSSRDLLQ